MRKKNLERKNSKKARGGGGGRGWYASCGHTKGLSCSPLCLLFKNVRDLDSMPWVPGSAWRGSLEVQVMFHHYVWCLRM